MRLIDFFQLMVFPFSQDAEFPWRAGSLFSSLQGVIEVFEIISYFSTFPWASYLLIFYFGIFLVVLVIIDIIYVLYSMARKRFTYIWPLKALTSFCSIFVTILFLPLLKLFVSMISCKTGDEGKLVHAYYPDQRCWTGLHILHSIMAITVSILFILISLIVTLTFYETKTLSENAGSKVNSRTDVFLLIYKIACIVLFAFFPSSDYSWILVLVIFLGSSWNYFQVKKERPYYNETISLLWNITNAIYLWVNISLLLCMILKNTTFSGGVQMILVGIPIVGLLEYLSKHPVSQIGHKKFENCMNEVEVENFLRYLTYVFHNRSQRMCDMLLSAYVDNHFKRCKSEKCPITIYHRSIIREATEGRGHKGNSSKILFLSHIKTLYKLSLKKYPDCVGLRIRYAFFLLEFSETKTHAVKQLNKAEKYKTALDNSFVIYRYRRLLQEDISNTTSSGVGMDAVSILAYNNYFRQFSEQLEKGAQLHIDFWSKLNTQIPDIVQLLSVGTRISKTLIEIESYWNQMQGINPNQPAAVKLYSTFQREVLHDDEAANDLLKTIAGNFSSQKIAEVSQDIEADESYLMEAFGRGGTPVICVSGGTENSAMIKNISTSLCRILGATPQTYIGKPLIKIIPKFIARYHEYFIHNATENREEVHFLNKELLLPMKLANGYILMVYFVLKTLPSFANNMNFVGIFKIDRAVETQQVCYLLLLNDGTVEEVSEKAISMLQITADMVKSHRIMQNDIFLDLDFLNISKYKTEANYVHYKFPTRKLSYTSFSEDNTIIKVNHNILDINRDYKKIRLKCMSMELMSAKYGCLGYVIKLSQIVPPSNRRTSVITKIYSEINTQFQFFFDTRKEKYGRMTSATQMIPEEKKELNDSSDSGSHRQIMEESHDEEEKEDTPTQRLVEIKELLQNPHLYSLEQFLASIDVKKKGFDTGIITKRYFKGEFKKVKSIPAQIRSIYQQQEIEVSIINQETQNTPESLLERARINKVKAQIHSPLEFFPTPSHITHLRLIPLLLIFAYIAMILTENIIASESCNRLEKTIGIAWQKSNVLRLVSRIYTNTMTMVNAQSGIKKNYENTTNLEEYMSMLKNQSKYLAIEIQSTLKSFAFESQNAPKIIQDYIWSSDNILTSFSQNGTQASKTSYSYYEMVILMNDALLSLISTDNVNITELNTDVCFIRYNALNPILKKSWESRDINFGHWVIYYNLNMNTMIALFISALCLNVILVMVNIPFLLKASEVKEEALTAFLCIPRKAITKLQQRCEHYLLIFNTEKEQDDTQTVRDSMHDPIEGNNQPIDPEEEEDDVIGSYNRKRFRRSSGEKCLLVVKLILLMIVLDFYFVFSYLAIYYMNIVLEKRSLSLNAGSDTSLANEISFSILRELVLQSNYSILGSTNHTDTMAYLAELYRSYMEEIITKNLITDSLYLGDHLESVDKWMYDSLCESWETYEIFANKTQCSSYCYGVLAGGAYNILSIYYMNIRKYITLAPSSNPSTIFSSKDWICAEQINRYIIGKKMVEYVDFILKLTKNFISKVENAKLITMIIVIILSFLAYFSIWLPYIYQMKIDLLRTDSMLMLIPTSVISNSKYLKDIFDKKYSLIQVFRQKRGSVIIVQVRRWMY